MAEMFAPFDLGRTFAVAEQIKGMRRQSVLDDLQAQYTRGQIDRAPAQEARAVSQETRAAAQESRAVTDFSQEQQLANTQFLNMAAAEVVKNPQAAKRWEPILKSIDPNFSWGQDPTTSAKTIFESTSAALQAYRSGSGATQAKPSALIEQYEQAVSEGYKGGYLDFVQEQSRRQVGAQYGAPTDVPGVGVVQPSRTQGEAGNVVISPEASVVASGAERAGAEATARNEAEAVAEQNKEFTANQRTLEVWNVAKGGLERALSGTRTGPEQALLPAVTSGQQIADGAVAAVAPVLKQLFRSAGEGVFTDRDQQLLLDMVPTREDHDETRVAKLQMIDAIIQAKLAASIPGDDAQTGGQITEDQYNALPSGAQYVAPDGTTRTKR